MHASVENRDALVEVLIEVWREALGVEVTADSDFFALGGTSIAAISIAQAVARHYCDTESVEVIALKAVFEQVTLGDMADELRDRVGYASMSVPSSHNEAKRAG